MRFDWQTIAVALIVLGALVYVVRRALSRLHAGRGGAVTACGNCPSEKPAVQGPAPRVLVQIDRSRLDSNRRAPGRR